MKSRSFVPSLLRSHSFTNTTNRSRYWRSASDRASAARRDSERLDQIIEQFGWPLLPFGGRSAVC